MDVIPINNFVLVEPITPDRLIQRASTILLPKADQTGRPTRGTVLYACENKHGIKAGSEVIFSADQIKAINIEGKKMLPVKIKEIGGVIDAE